jgi:7-cyano-7-deazaguanine synthase
MVSGDTMNKEPAAVVLLSGGLDSMVCAGLAREQGFRLFALTIDYNQRHRIELDSAKVIAARLGAERHVILPLDLRQFGGSALTDAIDVPKGGVGEDIPVTYVPARNLVFLSLALAWAEAVGSGDLFIGVNALDYSGYPDCRPEFIAGFEGLARIATKLGDRGGTVRIHAPLQQLRKSEIAREAARLGLDPAESWSCYDPLPDGRACGECDSCRLRRAGFAEAGLDDGSKYAA